ncbi:molybdate ABC transporter substrate-binding protein [Rapidithrix thailandica]|uniref:Molybdate ABC transporter substrate-binding protein n=1 Tax=Rapidithrix thailandica TaxID=413964 RepID=A0AAW9S4A5_9BACT
MGFSACAPSQENREKKDLFFYCAAGMKPAVEKIAKAYQQEFGVTVNIQYGGSGTLLSNLRIAKGNADLYLAADQSYIDNAREYDLIEEVQPVAFLRPVIAVAKGNPKNIQGLNDLKNPEIKTALANPDAASVGRQTKKILQGTGDWDAINANVKVLKPTVNEVANDIKLGAIDAGIIWDATANQYPEIEQISVPEFDAHRKKVTVAVLKSSSNPTQTLHFIRYMASKNKGLKVFEELGYQAVEGDTWEDQPEILFYSGGVNRVAIEKTIQAFEKREGVNVTRVYNGCGILVSQIKAGQNPDAYFSCDRSFMDDVQSRFTDIQDVSHTKIVILTNKENTHQIHSLEDLTKEGISVGVCNPQQSALGALTARMLEGMGLLEGVMKNVKVQTPTADLLVNQLKTGALGAAIVYEANTSQVKDQLTVIPLSNEGALAVQNFGISTNSKHKYLTQRLFQTITSQTSKANFENNGFGWEYQQAN